MTKILAALFVATLSLGIGICVMMFGWGLEPKSWGWIIGGSLSVNAPAILLKIVLEKEENG
jgi:Kef-type K+ transport system membrane component KefB